MIKLLIIIIFFVIMNVVFWWFQIKNNYYHKDRKAEEFVKEWQKGWDDRDKKAKKEMEREREIHENERAQDDFRYKASLKEERIKNSQMEDYIADNHYNKLQTDNDKIELKEVAKILKNTVSEINDFFRDKLGDAEKLVIQTEKLDEVKKIAHVKSELDNG